MNTPILQVKDLKKHFNFFHWYSNKQRKSIKAVDGVTFDVYPKQTFGIVGESGCGKSTIARLVLRLIDPTAGEIRLETTDLCSLDRQHLRVMRKRLQVIFQDPFSSLDPRKTIASIIAEPLNIHRVGSRKERRDRVAYLMDRVGLKRAFLKRYPHEFSGGQRQRIAIARALILNPDIIICDEAVSALDVSIQAQVLNLLKEIQADFGLTYLFISHDLSVVRHISNRIAVMYLGKIVEIADAATLFSNPLHPYTRALLSAVPVADPRKRKKPVLLEGDVPNPGNPPLGCRFHTRCKNARSECEFREPMLKQVADDHLLACHEAVVH